MYGSTEGWIKLMRKTPRAGRPIVLCLHDVSDAQWLGAFVDALGTAGEFIDLDTFMDRRDRGTFTGREWVITLDDGERSLRDVVHPTLTARGIPYAAFIITDVLEGGPVPWFYRYQALRERLPTPQIAACFGERFKGIRGWTELTGLVIALPWEPLMAGLERAEEIAGVQPPDPAHSFLDAAEVAELADSPLATMGAHTHRHPILSNLSAEEQRGEIQRSVDVLTRVLGEAPRYFAYPSGREPDFNEASVNAVRSAGLHAAFTTVERAYDGMEGVYRIPRMGVVDGMSLSRFALKLSIPWHSRSSHRETRHQKAYRDMQP
jgi:peptidoglycan/xylan/chitin deacetylase (PgdA/CDA1 family)